jgi:hypothetical protein
LASSINQKIDEY